MLFVGNSYTYLNDLPALVSALAEAGGHRLETRMLAPGGWRLRDHLERGEAPRVLSEGGWDAVVLQEQSALGQALWVDGLERIGDDRLYRPWVERWTTACSEAGARPILYLTWARRHAPEDQRTLDAAVLGAARATGAAVAPVGPAWALVRARRPALELYDEDGSHPSPAGSTLAACTFYATLFATSPLGLPGKLSGLPVDLDTEEVRTGETAVLVDLGEEDAGLLQQAAWEAVQDLPRAAPAPAGAPMLRALPRGTAFTEESLAGTWTGSLRFSPTGPADVELSLEPLEAGAWCGYIRVDFHSRSVKDLRLDLEHVPVEAEELVLTLPKALLELDVHFRAALTPGGELEGRAEANGGTPDEPQRLLGSCTLRREDG